MSKKNITPSTGLLNVISHSSHTPVSAVADLVDNSIDAKATIIKINVLNLEDRFILSDNGVGMNEEEVVNAFKAGSHKDNTSALGKFGIGLKSSTTTIGKRFYVLTKNKTGSLIKGIYDPIEMSRIEKWEAEIGKTTNSEDIAEFNKYISTESGTVFVIKDLYEAVKFELSEKLRKHLEETFRFFLEGGIVGPYKTSVKNNKIIQHGKIKIFLDDDELYGRDPLERQCSSTNVVFNRVITTPYGNCKVSISELDRSDTDNQFYGSDHDHQGLYLVRENRQIASDDKDFNKKILGAKHSSVNHLRTEISYLKDMDPVFIINHDKRGLKSIDPSVLKKMYKEIKPEIRKLRNSRTTASSKNATYSKAKNVIPKSVTKKRIVEASQYISSDFNTNLLSDLQKKGVSSNSIIKFEYEYESTSFSDLIYYSKLKGDVVTCFINTNHRYVENCLRQLNTTAHLINTIYAMENSLLKIRKERDGQRISDMLIKNFSENLNIAMD